MKQAKYLQLLNAASQLNNTLTLHDQQLSNLSIKCKTSCTTMSSSLATTQHSVLEIDPNSCISSLQLESLHKFKIDLEKIGKELNKELLKPIMQINKSLAKIKQNIEQKISPALAEASEFDLEQIKQLLQRAQTLLDACQQRVNVCLADIQEVQLKIDAVDRGIHRLDLPNDIHLATKDVEKASQELSSLSTHLAQVPQGKERFRTEFLPLRTALEKLSLQSSAFLKEALNKETTVATEAKAAAVKNKI